MSNENEVLKTEIEHMKIDIAEIKADQKETNKYFRKTIDVLKENSIRQTEILKNQEQQFHQQFSELKNDMLSLNDDIAGLRSDVTDKMENQTKWYQDFLGKNFGLVFKILIIAVLVLSGAKLVGFDIKTLLSL